MTNVLVLGSTGMLGSEIMKIFREEDGIDVIGTTKTFTAETAREKDKIYFDAAQKDSSGQLRYVLSRHKPHWIINCIGTIKPNIVEGNSNSVTNAIKVNSIFPHILAEAAYEYGVKVIQIATDCVYSGADGAYTELCPHDAYDVYGKTKSLGEVKSDDFYNIRCSIIGREPDDRSLSLYEWISHQEQGAKIHGYKTHFWNGLSTKAFADVSKTIVRANLILPNTLHLIPGNQVDKYKLLKLIAKHEGREDIEIVDAYPEVVDRTLDTVNTDLVKVLWFSTYGEIPTVESMIEEI